MSENLDRYPNMHVDMAARIGELGRQPFTSKKFFDKYQDRILFATDATPHGDAFPQQVFNDQLYEIYYRFLETEDEYFDYAPAKIPPQGRWRIYGINLLGSDSAQGLQRKRCKAAADSRCESFMRIARSWDCCFWRTCRHAQVRVWQGTLTLPTYEEGLPDPNPPFDQFTTNRFNYPYTLRNNLTSNRVDQAWRAIYLENEYLKCSVLPDIGGHLYTCIDKISGKPMFYANPSIKKAAIAYRGAWAAFGVEFNFPVSHNWMTMSPVNFAFAQARRRQRIRHRRQCRSRLRHGVDGGVDSPSEIDRAGGARHAEQSQRCAASLLLVEQCRGRSLGRLAHRLPHAICRDARLHRDSPLARRSGWRRLQLCCAITPRAGFDVRPWQPRTLHGRVESAYQHRHRAFRGVRRLARQEDLVLGGRCRRPRLAQGPLRQQERISGSAGRTVSQPGNLCLSRAAPSHCTSPNTGCRCARSAESRERILRGSRASARKAGNLSVGFNANQAIPQATVSISKGKEQVVHEKVDLTPGACLDSRSSERRRAVEVHNRRFRTRRARRSFARPKANTTGRPHQKFTLGPQPSYRMPDPDKRSFDTTGLSSPRTKN